MEELLENEILSALGNEKGNIIGNKSLLKLIKSLYIFKKTFALVNENIKLNLIIYNKILQNKLGIDIKNYIVKSGKYKIG